MALPHVKFSRNLIPLLRLRIVLVMLTEPLFLVDETACLYKDEASGDEDHDVCESEGEGEGDCHIEEAAGKDDE